MKKTIAILLASLIIFWACGGGGGSDITVTPTPEPPIILPPEPEPDQKPKPRTIFIYNAAKPEIGSSDGTNYYQMSDGHAVNARDGFIAIGDILHGVDDTGESIISSRLPVVPDAVAISGDVWAFKNIDPATAQSLGAMAKWYTKIYQGPDEYGMWWMNQWQTVSAVVTNSGDIVLTDTVGKLRSVKEPGLVINFAAHNGIMVHSLEAVNLRAYVRDNGTDTMIYGTTNYFLSALKEWVEADGVWYSWNGFTWDGSNFTEQSTALTEFISTAPDSPVVVGAGSRIEHSEAVTYWIECNSGWLYRHTPSIDALEPVIQLWQGSCLRSDGIVCAGEVEPVLVGSGDDDNLFFGWNGTIWKYNFNDALVSSFAAGVEIWRM